MSFTLTRRTLINQSTRTTNTLKLQLRTMSSNPAISNPAKSETENRGPQFGFKERQPEAEEKKVMDDILNLYQLNPISTAYQHYDQKAVFSDPIGIAQGLTEVQAQFNAMPKIFSASYTRALKFLDNPEIQPPSFQVSLSQEYHMKVGSMVKTTDSKVTFLRDPQTKLITRHEEEWTGDKNSSSEDGFLGSLQEARKKFSAKMVNAFVDSTPYDQQMK